LWFGGHANCLICPSCLSLMCFGSTLGPSGRQSSRRLTTCARRGRQVTHKSWSPASLPSSSVITLLVTLLIAAATAQSSVLTPRWRRYHRHRTMSRWLPSLRRPWGARSPRPRPPSQPWAWWGLRPRCRSPSLRHRSLCPCHRRLDFRSNRPCLSSVMPPPCILEATVFTGHWGPTRGWKGGGRSCGGARGLTDAG
jgi:hypothetical protein